jgi:Rod binding domain-containing protein
MRIERTSPSVEAAGHLRRLRRLCEDFEALLVGYLLRHMRDADAALVGKKPFITRAYQEMFDGEVARVVVSHTSWGIAETLYRSLTASSSPQETKGSEEA